MPAPKQIPAAAFSAAWCDHSLTIEAIAKAFGMAKATASRAARTMSGIRCSHWRC